MRTPRSGRLGLLGVGAVFALVASALSPLPASAGPIPTHNSQVTVTKSWSPGTVNDDAFSDATLTATNGSPVMAENVYLIDYYDYGLTPVMPVPDCVDEPSSTGGRVVCGPFDIGPGLQEARTIRFDADYTGPKRYTAYEKRGERIDVQKAETHVSLPSKGTDTFTVKCPVGYGMVDMSFVKQHVDQDTGDFNDVHVVTSDLLATGDEWSVELYNDADGQAQGKLWAVCLEKLTNQSSPVQFETPIESPLNLHPISPGTARPLYAYCDVGETPVAIDLRAVADNSAPHPGGSSWSDSLIHKTGMEATGGHTVRVWVVVEEPANVTLEWQCLKTNTFGPGKTMYFETVSESKTVAPGTKDQLKLTCDHGYKGIVGGWTGGKINGTEPQPVSRIYWLWNEASGPKTYHAALLCMRTRLVKGGPIDHSHKSPLVNMVTILSDPAPGVVGWGGTAVKNLNVKQ